MAHGRSLLGTAATIPPRRLVSRLYDTDEVITADYVEVTTASLPSITTGHGCRSMCVM